ncbi:hypothetical protein BJV74DRAFT_781262 [Russula compacta]|nr:hypothetical protein BJV74DRAFT_781262 [Russula compacta]
MLKFPGSSPSCLQRASNTHNSAGITVDHGQAGTAYAAESTSDAPDDSSISSWASPKFFTDLSAFNITHFTSGRDNLEIVAGITPGAENIVHVDDSSSWTFCRNASTMLQIFYPKDSVNPAGSPQGGSQFYASPLDITKARNVTLEYDVFFPSDFEWVKGGKLPGLYGGRTRCSGGDPALNCFSTRLMWRADGAGELYLYAPKDRQTPSLCSAPPLSVCDGAYGLSISRGSFKFSRGAWTHLSQTVVLNTPGVQDGCFLLEVDGKSVINRTDVFYRDKPRELDPVRTPSVPCDTADAMLVQQEPPENEDDRRVDARPLSGTARETDAPISRRTQTLTGFILTLSTFFGGHKKEFATPKDQFAWFKDFSLCINDP